MQKKNKNPFSANGVKTNNKFVGGYVPQQTADYITLLALFQGQSVSKLLRTILTSWMSEKLPKERLIESLIAKANNSWNDIYKKSKGKSGWRTVKEIEQRHIDYKKTLRKILHKKKIEVTIVNKIMTGIKLKHEDLL